MEAFEMNDQETLDTTQDLDAPRLAVCQDWLESERGWGTRPDGHTLHLTLEDRNAYVEGHAGEFHSDEDAPDEYTRDHGNPRTVAVTEAVYERLQKQQQKVVGEGEDDLDYAWRRHGIWGHYNRFGPPAYQGEGR